MAEGQTAAQQCQEAAESRGWDSEAAGDFILAWLSRHGPTSGEVLVSEASKIHTPHDGRAFGAVFLRLSKRRLIEKCGHALRAKGRGTSGANIWRLVASQPQGPTPNTTAATEAA
jgi:hypothetical protein